MKISSMRRRVVVVLPVAVLLCSLVASCGLAEEPSGEVSEPFTPPAWFAQEAQAQELFAERTTVCMNSRGWVGSFDLDGGYDQQIPDADLDRFSTDIGECTLEQGYDPDSVYDRSREKYAAVFQKKLDVLACLSARVGGLESPPSQEQYIDDTISLLDGTMPDGGLWDPYADNKITALSRSETEALRKVCPDPWVYGK